MVDQIRFFAGACRAPRGPVGGRVHDGVHVVCAARADRCLRAGHAVELPDDDGGLEVRARHRGREHRRPQARPDDSGLDAAPGRDRGEFVPPGVFNVVCGDRDTGRALVSHPVPQMVSITGSVRAGREVAIAAADDIKRVHLELGGKAPVVVFDDADVEKAAEAIAIAGYFNAGQDCTAATGSWPDRGVHDDSRRRSGRAGPGPDRGAAPRSRAPTSAPQQHRPAGPGPGLHRHPARPRRCCARGATGSASGGSSTSPRW